MLFINEELRAGVLKAVDKYHKNTDNARQINQTETLVWITHRIIWITCMKNSINIRRCLEAIIVLVGRCSFTICLVNDNTLDSEVQSGIWNRIIIDAAASS